MEMIGGEKILNTEAPSIIQEIDQYLDDAKFAEIYGSCYSSWREDFDREHFNIFLGCLKRGILYIFDQCRPIAERFAFCSGTLMRYPDEALEYLIDFDSIVMTRTLLHRICKGIKNQHYGNLPDYARDHHMHIEDLIFLSAATQAYASYLSKQYQLAKMETEEIVQTRPLVESEISNMLQRTIKEQNISLFKYSLTAKKFLPLTGETQQ